MAVRSKTRFVTTFLAEFLEARLLDGQLTTDRYHQLRRQVENDARRLARQLFQASGAGMKYRGALYKLRYLREPDRRVSGESVVG